MHFSKTVRDAGGGGGREEPSLYITVNIPNIEMESLLRLSLALKTLMNDTEKVFVTNGATNYLTSLDITRALID